MKIMEVCGGHTNTIVKYGLRDKVDVELISGPGCPVCVTSQRDIDNAIHLALNGVKLAVYGDVINVPGTKMSLRDAKAQGADVQVIYSIDEIKDERVFFAVGFETTVPMTAVALKRGICVYSTHKVMGPAMKALADEIKIDGFIDPGHVSTIIGTKAWSEMNLGVPQVISGFKPDALLKSIEVLIDMVKNSESGIKNEYSEVVFEEGNSKAWKLVMDNMKFVDSEWRGLGVIPLSGLDPRDEKLNAKIKYAELLKEVKSEEFKGCHCDEVLKGIIKPEECPLFGKVCTPDDPKGACMVSESEGACGIAYKY